MQGFIAGQDWGDDFAGYIIQAQVLSSKDFPGLQQNIQRNDFLLNYPWGFPVILKPAIHLFSTDYVLLKKYVYLYFLLSLIGMYFLFIRQKTYALWAIVLMAASPYFWEFKNALNSDLPNLCFVTSSLFLINKLIVYKEKIFNSYFDSCLLGLSLFISYSIRTQSVVLIFTLLIMQLFYYRSDLTKSSRFILMALPYFIFLALKIILGWWIPVPAISYLGSYSDITLLPLLCNNIFYYTNVWSELFTPFTWLNKIEGIATGISLCLFFIGISQKWKENLLAIIFISGTLGLVLLTPFYQGIRYLMPVLPFFFFYIVKAVFQLCPLLYPRAGKFISYAFVIIASVLSLNSLNELNVKGRQTKLIEGPYSTQANKMFAYVKKNSSSDELIAFWKPRAMLLYSGRNGVLGRDLKEVGNKKPRYYVYYNKAYADQLPLDSLTMNPGLFKCVYENVDFKIFIVLKTPEEALLINDSDKPETASELVLNLNHTYFDPAIIYGSEHLIPLWSATPISSKRFSLEPGNYIVSVYCVGTPAGGILPENSLFINNKVLGNFKAAGEKTRTDFKYSVINAENLLLTLKLENDICIGKEDRNTLIYSIKIYKTLN